MSEYSSVNTIATVAVREMRNSLRSKGIMITLVIVLVGLVGGAFAGNRFVASHSSSSDTSVATYGLDSAFFDSTGYSAHELASPAEAEESVRSGSVVGALTLDGDTLTFIHDGITSPQLDALVTTLAQNVSLRGAVANLGFSMEQFAAATKQVDVESQDISADRPQDLPENQWNIRAAVIGIFILMVALTLFASSVGARVTEEKSSRIIEIIVSTVKPTDFLAGKILGNVAFGTLATGLILVVGAAALKFSGLLGNSEITWSIFPALFCSFLLGIFFFSSLYAAAGAMVQRTEDLQSTQTPIMLLIVAVLYTPTMFFSQLDKSWMQISAWIPPLSIGHAPLQYAAGNMSGGQFSLSMLILLLFTIGVILLSARIYTSAILNNSEKLKWTQVLRLS